MWGWLFRRSLTEIPEHDGEWILHRLQGTEPQLGPNEAEPESETRERRETRHTEIQYRLGKLAEQMGLDVWIASNDRRRSYSGHQLGECLRRKGSGPATSVFPT